MHASCTGTKQGLDVSIPKLLDASLFLSNALLTNGKSTPYQDVYSWQPAMLPAITDHNGSTEDSRLDTRVREIALDCMVQATVMARKGHLNAKPVAAGSQWTNPATAILNPGDLVDVSDDGSTWVGPATVTRVVHANGNIIVKHSNGRDYAYRRDQVRLTLLVFHSLFTGRTSAPNSATEMVKRHIQSLKTGDVQTFGRALDRTK